MYVLDAQKDSFPFLSWDPAIPSINCLVLATLQYFLKIYNQNFS